MGAKKLGQVKEYMQHSIKYFLILAIPYLFGILYLAPFILKSLATEEFVTSRFLILLIVTGYIFYGLGQIVNTITYLKEKTHFMPFILGTSAALNLGLNFLFIPRFGIIGAAFTTFLSYILIATIYLFLAKKWFPINFEYITSIKAIISALIMVFFLTRFTPKNILETLIIIFIGSLIYFGCMLIIKGIGLYEWILIKGIFKKQK